MCTVPDMAGILYCLPLTSDWLKSEDEHAQSDLQECLGCLQENRAPLIVTAETGSYVTRMFKSKKKFKKMND